MFQYGNNQDNIIAKNIQNDHFQQVSFKRQSLFPSHDIAFFSIPLHPKGLSFPHLLHRKEPCLFHFRRSESRCGLGLGNLEHFGSGLEIQDMWKAYKNMHVGVKLSFYKKTFKNPYQSDIQIQLMDTMKYGHTHMTLFEKQEMIHQNKDTLCQG